MSISVARDQGSLARLQQAQVVQTHATQQQQATTAAAVNAALLNPGDDPRSIAALSQALSAFLNQMNGAAAPTAANSQAEQAANAYGVPTPQPEATQAASRSSGFDGTLDKLKDDFGSLMSTLRSVGQSLTSLDGDTITQMKAQVTDFVRGLMKVTGDMEKAGQAKPVAPQPAPAAPAPQAAVKAVAPAPSRPAPDKPGEKPSLLAHIGSRFQRHFEDL